MPENNHNKCNQLKTERTCISATNVGTGFEMGKMADDGLFSVLKAGLPPVLRVPVLLSQKTSGSLEMS